MNLKNNRIVVSGVELYFNEEGEVDEWGATYWTDFYTIDGLTDEMKWSWRKLRKVATGKQVDKYTLRFTLDFWITTSTDMTKDELRNELEKKVELMNRALELERKEFI